MMDNLTLKTDYSFTAGLLNHLNVALSSEKSGLFFIGEKKWHAKKAVKRNRDSETSSE